MATLPDIRPLHVGKILPPPYAGVEAHVDTLLRALAPEVVGTLVACGDPDDARRRQAEFPYRLLVARQFGKFASVSMAPGMVVKALRELRAGRCNLLHIHAPYPWGDLSALGAGRNTPVVMTWHSDIVRQQRLLMAYRHLQRRVIERADRIVVLTPRHYASSTQLVGRDIESKLVSIPLSIDVQELDPAFADASTTARLNRFAAGRPLALTVGRHVYYKGYEHLLAALSQLRSDAVLAMIGTGPLEHDLKRMAQERGLEQRVLFLGEVDRPVLVAALHRCDFFCLPSIAPSEAFGIASAEAMACGKPTIVCQLHNGVNYLNQDGRTSLTVSPGDVPALADAIDTLAREHSLRARLGDAAAEWIRSEFGIEQMRRRTLELYRSLV